MHKLLHAIQVACGAMGREASIKWQWNLMYTYSVLPLQAIVHKCLHVMFAWHVESLYTSSLIIYNMLDDSCLVMNG